MTKTFAVALSLSVVVAVASLCWALVAVARARTRKELADVDALIAAGKARLVEGMEHADQSIIDRVGAANWRRARAAQSRLRPRKTKAEPSCNVRKFGRKGDA